MLNGKFKGEISSNDTLIIGEKGVVNASIRAGIVLINGEVVGNVLGTEREPGMSSAGSGSAVAANLVTCAIGEETVVSVRWPSAVNSLVGLAPTVELVSRDGMMGSGLNMRVGPMCRTTASPMRSSRRCGRAVS
jgi:hypothetical protein